MPFSSVSTPPCPPLPPPARPTVHAPTGHAVGSATAPLNTLEYPLLFPEYRTEFSYLSPSESEQRVPPLPLAPQAPPPHCCPAGTRDRVMLPIPKSSEAANSCDSGFEGGTRVKSHYTGEWYVYAGAQLFSIVLTRAHSLPLVVGAADPGTRIVDQNLRVTTRRLVLPLAETHLIISPLFLRLVFPSMRRSRFPRASCAPRGPRAKMGPGTMLEAWEGQVAAAGTDLGLTTRARSTRSHR